MTTDAELTDTSNPMRLGIALAETNLANALSDLESEGRDAVRDHLLMEELDVSDAEHEAILAHYRIRMDAMLALIPQNITGEG